MWATVDCIQDENQSEKEEERDMASVFPQNPIASTGVPESVLSLTTFGSLTICWQGEDITYVIRRALEGRGPSLILLKILLCCGCPSETLGERDAGISPFLVHEGSIDWLIETIWSDRALEMAAPEQALRKAKSQLNIALRPYLGGDLIVAMGRHKQNSYRLESRLVRIDADLFEQATRQASWLEKHGEASFSSWQRAALLYTGDFLPADLYADWSNTRRRRLESAYRRCLVRLCASASSERERAEASETLYSYLTEHPDELDLLCALVPLLREQQRYQEALELCDRLESIYEEEKEDLPTEVSQLIKVLRTEQRNARIQQLGLSPLALAEASARSEESLLTAPSRTGDPALSVVVRSPQSANTARLSVPWFDLKLKQWKLLLAAWRGRALYCEELQAILDQELAMTDLVKSLFDDYPLTRRKALLTLSTIPVSLLGAAREEPTSAKVLEDFLPGCASGLTACHHLMRGQDIFLAEKSLKQFLPVLEYVAEQPSLHQVAAARLAAQARMMQAVLAWHRLNDQDRIVHLNKALEYSRLSQDTNLLITVLSSLSNTYTYLRKPEQTLPFLQEAFLHEQEVSPFVRSQLYTRAAFAYAQLGEEHKALSFIEMAQTAFPDHPEHDPAYAFTDYGVASLYLHEGFVYARLNKPQSAEKAFMHIIENPLLFKDERTRIQIVNHQAGIALAQGDMEKFQHYFLLGVEGAKALKSQKRRQEAIENWKDACKVWGNEPEIVGLAERLM